MKKQSKHYPIKIKCGKCGSNRMRLAPSKTKRLILAIVLMFPLLAFIGIFIGPFILPVAAVVYITLIITTIKSHNERIYVCPVCKRRRVVN